MNVAATEWPIDPLWLLVGAILLVVIVVSAVRRRPETPPRPTRTLDAAASSELCRGVTEHLAQGRKIEAIKSVREALGLDLKDSKDIVDRIERGESAESVLQGVMASANSPSGRAEPAPDVEQAARDAMARDDKLEAIRVVRQHTGMGLAEAKAYVERL